MKSSIKSPSGLGQLLQNPQIWRASDTLREQNCTQQTLSAIATGFQDLDQELPDGGWPSQGLVELLCAHWGTGEIPLLSPAMAQLSQQGRWLAWVSPPWQPYAPGLIHAGVDINNILIVKPSSEKEALWAMEECLQSGSCSAVLGWPKHPLPQQLKRLNIAAQKGDSLCVLMRHEQQGQQPSPAPLRIEVGTLQKHLSLRIVKRRGSWSSPWLKLPLPEYLSALTTQMPTLQAAQFKQHPQTAKTSSTRKASGLALQQPAASPTTPITQPIIHTAKQPLQLPH